MVSRGEERRSRLFRRYSANLAIWRPEIKGQYVCPLCLRGGFEEEAVLGPNPPLTEEHCIQQGLGDVLTVLTCADCNNSAGRSVDNHLHKRLDFVEFWKGTLGEAFNGRITVWDHDLGVEVRRSPGKLEFHVQERRSDPAKVQAVQESLTMGRQPSEFRLHFGSKYAPDTKRSRIAVLKSAYLLMFRHFGYGYILSTVLNPVRQQICDPKSETVPLNSIVFTIPIESLPDTVSSITRPDGFGGFGVPVPLRKRAIGYFIIMPSDGGTFARWSEYGEGRDRDKSVQFSYDAIHFHESLLTERPFEWNTHTTGDSSG